MVLLSLTLSCLAQFPFDVSPTFQVPVQPGFTPVMSGPPAVAWNGSEYFIVWSDPRRSNGRLSLFAAALSGGGLTTAVPGGSEVPQSLGVSASDLHLVTTKTGSVLVASMTSSDGGVRLVGWKAGLGAWDGGWEPRFDISGPISPGLSAAAANERDVLVVWWSPGAIRGIEYPMGTPVVIGLDAGVTSMSAGGIDGGFLVSWVEPQGNARSVHLTASPSLVETLPVTGASRTQALTNFTTEVVMSQSASFSLHRYTGSWTTTSLGTPTGVALSSSTPSVIFTALPNPGGWVGLAHLATTAQSAPLSNLGPLLGVQALAARSDSDRALLVFKGGLRDVQVRELFTATAAQPFSTTPIGLGPIGQPLVAPASQRSPSVVWFDQKARFLLAFEEDAPDGGSSLQLSLLDPGQAPGPSQTLPVTNLGAAMKAELLRAPAGAQHAVALTDGSSRIVNPLQEVAGQFVRGPPLTSPRALPSAVLGDRIAIQWGNQGGLTASANTEAMARIQSVDLAPRCVAVARDKLWFVTNGASGVHSIDDQTTVTASQTTLLSWIGPPIVTPCAQATSTTPPLIYLAGSDGGLVQVRRFSPVVVAPFPVARLGEFGAITDELSAEPVIATVDAGALVTWASARNGVQVGWATSSGVLAGPALGGDDVTALSIASNPSGQSVIAWETFDVKLGLRRVQFRYLFPQGTAGIDGGVSDSGVATIDSGVIDSGVIDSGVVPIIDSGVIDSGVIVLDPDSGVVDQDAGVIDQDSGVTSRDSGVVDQDSGVTTRDAGVGSVDSGVEADGGVEVVFVPVCGCSESDSSVLPFFLLAAVMLAWRRRSHV